ncbi:MAG: hypothetical protein WC544_02245 [Patescibacteria group bacterium]
MPGASKYAIFRETVSTVPHRNEQPAVLVFGFRLKLIGSNIFFHWLFQRVCILTTPFWSGFPGFHTKLWMVDPLTKNYLGVYQWLDPSDAQGYIHFLIPIINVFSKKNSIWYQFYPDTQLDHFLQKIRASNSESQPSFYSTKIIIW